MAFDFEMDIEQDRDDTLSTVIFDIDGTIANIEHRRHFVQSKPKNWGAFNRAMKDDTPHWDMIDLMSIIYGAGYKILIASGRGEEDRKVTEKWLHDLCILERTDETLRATYKGIVQPIAFYEKLYMRPAADYRPDNEIKSEILDQMIKDGFEPTMAIDDRDQVVKMWRERGLRCLQVAPGDF